MVNDVETIQFYSYNNDRGIFELEDIDYDYEVFKFTQDQKITNLIALDLNNDNFLDFIISYSDKKNNLYTDVYLGYKEKLVSSKISFHKLQLFINTEFILGDFNGDRL